ncbi:GntR family transcriptional regulator [Pandoraea sp. XJJ-1]|uniref:GntR family transcriptional regulator n=2 Tax=Pandoraea TaxID=93217 RepID=UPI000B1407A4|nr:MULTISPECIES: GntR family transcriptional regulator [unclassified Pandoraea]WAL82245.1 GntR family transcriptional regulator [Pandoraea sp. XJJ-1]BDD92759.1 GntR family transcriptional regulator [Pandoraea sp. NE5]
MSRTAAPASPRDASRPKAATETATGLAAGDDGTSGSAGQQIEARVYTAISQALLSGKLRPGMPLRERNLAQALDCTRGAVRKVLARLGFEGKLVLEPNRGAFVPQPSLDAIRQTYRARRVLESGVIASLCGQLSASQLAALDAHVALEARSHAQGTHERSIRLAGEFHLTLIGMAQSVELDTFARQLVAKTELYKALYDPAEFMHCAPTEHAQLVGQLRDGKTQAAIAIATAHLDELEARVLTRAAAAETPDFRAIFAEAFAGTGA